MNLIRPTAVILLILTTVTTAALAQQKRQTPARPQPRPAATPAPTFDTLIPADSYTIYGEVRGVGQLIRSNNLNDVLDPVLKLAGPPKEFRSIVKWLDAHADDLMTSRVLVATWPIAKEIPEMIFAVEFASSEEAAKFATPLNEFLPTLFPTPTPSKSPEAGKKPTAPVEPNFHLQQAGSLILLTPKPLKLDKLRAAANKALADDNNFRITRNRFNAEPIFVFIDLKGMQRQEEERQKQFEESRREAERKRRQDAATETAKQTESPSTFELTEQKRGIIVGEPKTEILGVGPSAEPGKEPPAPDPFSTAVSMVGSSLFQLESKWPDAVAVALAFESDSFDVRAVLVSQPGEKSDAVPFLPVLIPGPPIIPESPNILPADIELFLNISVDLPQVYATLSRPKPPQTAYTSRGNLQTVNEVQFQPPFAAIEKLLKISIKDDLLPLLGSEVAVGLPLSGLGGVMGLPGPPAVAIDTKQTPADEKPAAISAPVVAVSLKDKEGMRALLPKLIEGFGFKGASAFAQTERRDDTELVSYANFFAYAFIGNFLVLSSDAATTRYVVDSYLKRETLSGDSNFKNYTRWQPRPSHGQIYISAALMEGYNDWARQPGTRISDQTRALLSHLTTVAQPITYSLSNEGFGPFHELHLPRSLVLMAITGMAGETNPPPELRNERMAMSLLYSIAYLQDQYKKTKGNGSYGTLEQMLAEGFISKEMIENSGYRIELTVSGDKFEVSAVPLEYGKSGSMSYFIDQTRILRGADRGGASATSSDPPVN